MWWRRGIKSFLFIGIKTVGYKWVSKKALLLALQTVPRNMCARTHTRGNRAQKSWGVVGKVQHVQHGRKNTHNTMKQKEKLRTLKVQ
nr:MAG TPA: hypothetical protein [Caudoviricetes sp.]